MPGSSKRIVAVAAGMAAIGTAFTAATAIPLGGAAVTWGPTRGPVPGAATHTAPALALLTVLPSKAKFRMLFWTGPGAGSAGFDISYQRSISLRHNTWSSPVIVDKGSAITRDQPSVAALAPGKLIVAWKDATSSVIKYAIGSAAKGTSLKWSDPAVIPGAMTAASPAVFEPSHSHVVLAAWQTATGDSVDYAIGFVVDDVVKWKIATIGKAKATSAPVIAERDIASGTGLLYVLWKGLGTSGPIDYATTHDPGAGFLKWSGPRALPRSVSSTTAPAAEPGGTGTSYPLLVVYGAGPSLLYVTLTKTGRTTTLAQVPRITGLAALNTGVLATDDPGNVNYMQPYVHICAGC